MAFAEDVADLIKAQVSHIGLGTSATVEVTGGTPTAYAHKVPTYGASAAGSTNITSTLQFDGPSGTVVTHVFYKKAGVLWKAVAVTNQAFNSSGRLDVTSASITVT